MSINEVAGNVWSAVGVAMAVFGSVLVAVINTRSSAAKKESLKVVELTKKIENLESEFRSLKYSFTLVCDQMELDDTMTPQLKQLRKMFDL